MLAIENKIKQLHTFFEFNSEQVYQLLVYINIWRDELGATLDDINSYIKMNDTFHIFEAGKVYKLCNTLVIVGLVKFDDHYQLTPLGVEYLKSCHR